MSDHDRPWGPFPSVPSVPSRTAPRTATFPPRSAAPPPPTRRSPWQRPWPWSARAACTALTCHVAAVVVNCAAEGVVNLGAGGGFTVGAMLIGLDAAVLLTVLARAHRRAGTAGEGER
ncbi:MULTISPECIES: hypothetical protein [Streptomyces violaceusniger group]|uniref:Uncharacterized protein n=2 Tax=Streptomyces rhizosphaericus TaxID=114699 RepID=A0ABP4CFH5_9ACTN|nr:MULTISPECIES: hypothetical protein [Streptomyces violaceusniger group]